MIVKILIVVSVLALLSTLICGAWIASKRSTMLEQELKDSVSFHLKIASFAVLCSVMSFVYTWGQLKR